jgi:hypothetical protein
LHETLMGQMKYSYSPVTLEQFDADTSSAHRSLPYRRIDCRTGRPLLPKVPYGKRGWRRGQPAAGGRPRTSAGT